MKKIKPEEFIYKSNIIHKNLYDYSFTNFIGVKINVKIICYKHGIFKQRPQHHLAGHGCRKCARELINDSQRLTKEDFIYKSKKIHENIYDYSKADYKNVKSNNDKVSIICKKHGEFKQLIRHHLSGSGCPICRESKGENLIRKFLIENSINFTSQKRFKNCRDKKPLPFDFYLPKHNLCIEYQGEQHFKPVMHWGGEKAFKNIKKRDKIKKIYCKKTT